jgi:CHAT domain-containing protein
MQFGGRSIMTRHRQSVWRSDIEFLSFVVGFFVTLLAVPPYLFAQGMLSIVPAEDYESLVPGPMLVRGAAPSTAFDEAFQRFQQGDFHKAQEEIEKIIEKAEGSKDRIREGVAKDFLGLIFQRQGRLNDAIQRHEAAMRILQAEKQKGREAWANAANNLAVAFYLRGEYEEARGYLNRIIEMSDLSPSARARALNNRGLIHHELGNLKQAGNDFALAADDYDDYEVIRAEIRNNQARIRALEGRFDDAIRRLQEAQKLAREAKDAVLEANILDSWADTLLRANRAKEALAKLDEAERLEKNAEAPLIKASIVWNRGRALALLKQNNEALSAFADAIKNTGETKLPALHREALTSRGDLYVQTGKLSEGIIDYEKAVELAQTTRSRLSGQTEKDFTRATQNLYEKLVRAYIRRKQPGDIDKALAWLDQSKSDALHRDMIKANAELRDQNLQKTVNGARGLLEQEAALSRQFQEALARKSSKEAVDRLQRELLKVRKDFTVAYGEIIQRYGERFGEFVGISANTFGDLKDKLPEGHLLVSFLPTDDALYFFLVAKNTGVEFRQNQKAPRKDLDQKIDQYRKLLAQVSGSRSQWRIDSWGDPRWATLLKLTTELHEALLQPIADRLSAAKHVIFAPTGLLHYMPLHALGPYDGGKKEIRFVIQDKAISYVTTATLLKVALAEPKTGQQTLLALGNPPFKHEGLQPLSHAEKEVGALQKLFGNRALALKGADATREALLAELAKSAAFSFVHLATHGVLNARAPTDSWLALDGTKKLLAREVSRLDLRNVNLVTLSACETGLAEEKPGGELMNMAAYFGAAGAHAIAVTLWSVDDQATQELMLHFYGAMLKQKNLDKATALQEAQKELASKPETRHPYFWAPFMLIGDWR